MKTSADSPVPCPRCGYDLHGAPVDGRGLVACSECGLGGIHAETVRAEAALRAAWRRTLIADHKIIARLLAPAVVLAGAMWLLALLEAEWLDTACLLIVLLTPLYLLLIGAPQLLHARRLLLTLVILAILTLANVMAAMLLWILLGFLGWILLTIVEIARDLLACASF